MWSVAWQNLEQLFPPFLPSQVWCNWGTGPQKLTCLRPPAEPVTAWHKTHELPARICWHLIWKPFWKTRFSITSNSLKPPQPQICELETVDHISCDTCWITIPFPQHIFYSLHTSEKHRQIFPKGNALSTGWILFPRKSESLGLCLWTCQPAKSNSKYFAYLPADT